jgi:four helix bundle protein
MSSGSASELENLLLLIYDLNYISSDQYEKLKNELVQIRKMLYGFITKLS